MIEPYLKNQKKIRIEHKTNNFKNYERAYIDSSYFDQFIWFRNSNERRALRIDYEYMENYILLFRKSKSVMIHVLDLKESDISSKRLNLCFLMSDYIFQKQKILLRPYFTYLSESNSPIISVNLKKSNRVKFIQKYISNYEGNFIKILRNETYLCCYNTEASRIGIQNLNSSKLLKSKIYFHYYFSYGERNLSTNKIQFFKNKAIAKIDKSQISLISEKYPFPKLKLFKYTEYNIVNTVAITNFYSIAVLKEVTEHNYLLEIFNISKIIEKSLKNMKKKEKKRRSKKSMKK